jgi:hypothetical protein
MIVVKRILTIRRRCGVFGESMGRDLYKDLVLNK